jgi:site-specific recombinase XerD
MTLKRPRGRPKGTTGAIAVLSSAQIRRVLKGAAARLRHGDRAEAMLALSIGVGLRAGELAALKWTDLYDGASLRASLVLVGSDGTSRTMRLDSPRLRQILATYAEKRVPWIALASQTPVFASAKGAAMTAASTARFLRRVYKDAGISRGSSDSGRMTLSARRAAVAIDPLGEARQYGRVA